PDGRAQAGGACLDGLVPADLLEAPLALGSDATPRMRHAARAAPRVPEAVDLGAERAVVERVRAIAAQRDGAAILDLDQPRAGVRAVQRAGAAHDRRHGLESMRSQGRRDGARMKIRPVLQSTPPLP